MNLHARTTALKAENLKALVPYFTAGYPDADTFTALMAAAARAGCPVIEVGIPFSDPVADGPAIQAAGHLALANGVTLASALDLCAECADLGPSLVAMSYVNPLLAMGPDTFAQRAADAGLGGVILPDVPLEESAELRTLLAARDLALIDLVAPTSGADRTATIAAAARGFLYLVSMTGVTGSALHTDAPLLDFVRGVVVQAAAPCYVGFGVSTPDHATALGRVADGVVIGSALTRMIGEAADGPRAVSAVEEYLSTMNAALNGGTNKEQP